MTEATQPDGFSNSLQLFDSLHWIALGLSLTTIVGVPLIGRCLSLQNRRRAVWALLLFTVAQEIVDYANRASFRDLNLIQDLPLHLCNYGLLIADIGLVTHIRFCFEFACRPNKRDKREVDIKGIIAAEVLSELANGF